MNKIWKDIIGYEGLYKVSNYGDVMNSRGKLRKLTKHFGYSRIGLSKNGISKDHPVHRLVAQAFIPNPNNYPQINHKDFNRSNNVVSNLEWCTRIQNAQHAIKGGRYIWYKGANHINAKLTNEQVIKIRELYKKKEKSQNQLAALFSVSQRTIQFVVHGQHYADILSYLERGKK